MRIFHHFTRSEEINQYIDLTGDQIREIIEEAEIENEPDDYLQLTQDQLETIFKFNEEAEIVQIHEVGEDRWFGNSNATIDTLDYEIQSLEDELYEEFPHSTEWIVRQDQIITFEITVTASTAKAARDQVKNQSIFENGTSIKVTAGEVVASYRKVKNNA